MRQPATPPWHWIKALLMWLAPVACVAAAYFFFYEKNAQSHNVPRYAALAESFLRGHTYLPEQPRPELLRLRNPYNAGVNWPFRAHDMSLYRGRYYMYFGPMSALLAAALQLCGMHFTSDAPLTLIWSLALALTMAAFFQFFAHPDRVKALCAPFSFAQRPIPFWLLAAGYGNALLGTACFYCLYEPRFYEAAIMGGAFFFWAGVVAALYGLASARNAAPWLFASGAALGCAFMSRYSCAFAIGAVGLMVGFMLSMRWRRGRLHILDMLCLLLCMGVPLLLTLAAFFWYNLARFNAPWETGLRYQLSGFTSYDKVRDGLLFNAHYFTTNLWAYFLRPVHYLAHFPFLRYQDSPVPQWAEKHFGYEGINTLGLLRYDYALYAPAALLTARWVKRQPFTWNMPCIAGVSLLAICALQLLPLLFVLATEIRYGADFMIALAAGVTFLCAGLRGNSPTRTGSALIFIVFLLSMASAVLCSLTF